MRLRFLALLAALFLLSAFSTGARAVTSGWDKTDHTAVRLISASSATGGDGELTLGLHFKMADGWKIYWRSPGDAGFPPQPIWEGSRNLSKADLKWPAPERFSIFDLETLGYKEEVVFPIEVSVKDPLKPLLLDLKVPYLTCADICIPYTARLSLDLPSGPADVTEEARLIDAFLAQVPPTEGSGLAVHDAAEFRIDATAADEGGTGDVAKATLVAFTDAAFGRPDIYLEGSEGLTFGKPRISLADAGRKAVIRVDIHGLKYFKKLSGKDGLENEVLVATLIDGDRSLEARVNLEPEGQGNLPLGVSSAGEGALPRTAPGAETPASLTAILLLAVLGGLILNLMPCVLPVLSLKILKLASHGGAEPRAVRLGFLAASAGIFAAFMGLAAALAALKSAGAGIGWGIQFQQPWFLAVLAVIMTVFACNLFGFFEIRIPGMASDLDAKAAGKSGMTGHFLQGMLATILATPCSAPFLGAAVGFALAGSTFDIIAVFAGLALGLSLPYLGVAAYPKAAAALPKPGPWMTWLKKILGLALATTAVWLVTVIKGAAGDTAATAAAAALLAIAALLGLGRNKLEGRAVFTAGTAVLALAAVLGAERLASADGGAASAEIAETRGRHWQAFDAAAIPALVADGKTVIVDVTADWCITCQVNKKLVLDAEPVALMIADENVIAMVADWTRPDPSISDYLKSFGRYGIPFNVVYGKNAPHGAPLPELLTADAVTAAFLEAAGGGVLARR